MRTWNQYSAIVVSAGIVIPMLATFCVNLIVDPYQLWNTVKITGFNEFKPSLHNRVELAKLNEIRRAHPSAIVLGSSRAGFLNTSHAGWGDLKAYNLSLPGARLSKISDVTRVVAENDTSTLERIVFGIDFFMFTNPTTSDAELQNQTPFGGASSRPAESGGVDPIRYTVSSATLLASFETYRYNRSLGGLPETQELGAENLLMPNALTDSRAALTYTLRSYQSKSEYFYGTPGVGKFADPENQSEFRAFRNLLDLCHRDKIDLHMFLSPVHATHLHLYERLGEWDNFEDLKRRLVAINTDAARQAGAEPFPLWDFSGFDEFTTEAVPKSDDDDRLMKYYYESSHYRDRLGDMMLDRIFDLEGADARFGVLLTPETIDEHIVAVRNNRDAYVSTQVHRDTLDLFAPQKSNPDFGSTRDRVVTMSQ